MPPRTFVLAPTLAVAVCAAALGCNRSPMEHRSRVEKPLAPTSQDLERAYRTPDPNLAGHQSAEAVVADGGGITVLCSANPRGEGDHTWVIRLAADGTVAWERHYPDDQGVGRALAPLPGGGYAIAGEIQRGAMAYQAYLLHVDTSGGVVAGAAYGPRGVTGFRALAVLGDGSLLAGGGASFRGWLVRIDSALRAIWDAPLDDTDDIFGVAGLAGGGFAVVARRALSTTSLDFTRLAAFDREQHLAWQKQLPATGRGEPAALAALPDGGLVVVGRHSATERDDPQMWVVRLNGSGDVLWETRIGGPGEVRRGAAIVALPDGGFAVAGVAHRDLGHRGLRLARLASDGTVLWERAYGGERRDEATGLAHTADGGFVLVGSTTSRGAGKTNVWILKLDGDGRPVWDRVFGTAG